MNLYDIKSPADIKDMSIDELNELAAQIRRFLIESISHTGGHLASNLGVVELTIALDYVFNTPRDKVFFDVGHQSYTHKILTGRASQFATLRQYNGLSGFQKRSESIHDVWEAGHSSTTLSAALGMAVSRDLNHKNFYVVPVIGDGALGSGMALEALNCIGSEKRNMIIIFNDNNMSISKNVGALSKGFTKLRAGKGYNDLKRNMKSLLNRNDLGKHVLEGMKYMKDSVKDSVVDSGIFGEFNLEYMGPVNGHNIADLIKVLNVAKLHEGPVVVHVITKKGFGYEPAENDENGSFHGVGPFNIKDGKPKEITNLPSYSEIMSSYVLNYAKKDKDIIVITPAMEKGCKLSIIKEKLPKQFIDVGINEEHALVLASSLAENGKKPICFIYSSFLQRGYDEIVHDIARMNEHVILCIDRAGFVSSDGETHQGLFDVPMLLPIPNMVISMPSSPKEADNLLELALKTNKPFAIRYPKINLKYDFQKKEDIVLGSWSVIASGEDGVIITYGDFVSRAQNICEKLSIDNINLTIINARFLKPIDEKMLTKILKYYKKVFIYEESMEGCSLDSVVLSFASKINSKNDFYIYNIPNKFMFTATREELIKLNNLDEESIYNKIKNEYKK